MYPKQSSCKRSVEEQEEEEGHYEKICEIQGGSQEMVVIVG